ncbi:hypothetical protein K431DRAFT_282148 [Polychaeton citri CBS 116435]|uniref:Uncharacterized protein n=1 Tax=Polychaeton citri CBS 116435 TaxID=1314669 RepID=A0A9P4QDA0_9PEZI|nr:hypothetical protein K431DRAFT_282148 [Polychaeton citri CBS 116435]
MVCHRCQQIPFEDPPVFDPSQHCTHSGPRSKNGLEYFMRDETSINSPKQAFALHESICALVASSANCALCQIISAAVQRYWTIRKPFESNVWIAKMPDGYTRYSSSPLQKGIAVFLGPGPSSGQMWYALIAALGICVDSSES